MAVLILLTSSGSFAQVTPNIKTISAENYEFSKIAALPKVINEASGLAAYDRDSIFWTHNDGGKAILYGIDRNGTIKRVIHLINKNRGWEDLTIDKDGHLYIAATGNNKNDKKELKIYKLPDVATIVKPLTLADAIIFSYEDQDEYPASPSQANFDCDAIVSMGDSIYLFSKNRTFPFNGVINVYALPNSPGQYVAKKTDSFKLNGTAFENWITGVDVSNDGKLLAILFHNKIIFIENFAPGGFSKGDFYTIPLGHFSHKAGICFTAKDTLYIVDEMEMGILGGNIYQLNNKYFTK